ncbi:isoleucine--tRNA ligase [Mycoplasmoides pirum]|uniref:isoleucine--tRNA ligase n=1 Tax=Mycoplasmoides pirum TaxID=2122 RepID=UPI00047F69C5|nr:isoleucine--tRNA ligase [Mycoplasmoides pirum]
MDYKKTLNIPETAFEMKANLNQKELVFQEKWLKTKLYENVLESFKSREMKILHDGPPYANGNLHVGHALNKILKDFVIRSWILYGYNSLYIPGWDTHGLPIEHAVSQKTKNYNSLSTIEKRNLCLEYAKTQIKNQKEQFARFGLLTDFDKCYYTYEQTYEIDQLNAFLTMVEKDLIYQDLKPIYWSWSSRSALADAEVEYADVKASSIYVSFNVVESNSQKIQNQTKLLIWTTTPWTIPANQAICVNPNFQYVLVRTNEFDFVIVKDRLDDIAKTLSWNDYKILDTINGTELNGIKYVHPMYPNQFGIVILGEHVKNNDGTGLVHCAPGFGADDYNVCKKNNINEMIVHLDDSGKINSDFHDEKLREIFYLDANKTICDVLKSTNNLHFYNEFVHSEPHDWRTKKPVIYRATKQWFINISKIKNNLENNINTIKFQNDQDYQKLLNMVTKRTDWCISRQRVWGVPIPIIFDENKNPIMDLDLIKNIIKKIEEHGSNSWFEKPVEFFLTEKYLNNKTYFKEQDIMDVWIDSGVSYNVLNHYNLKPQADIYLEGIDQYRGWFNSSLICSTIQNNIAPYKELFSHGITLDEKGHKMSKSIGNVVDPIKICNQYGADILRLWVCFVDYSEDNRIGDKILLQVSEQYRKIRNTLFRYILSNINDFDFQDFNKYDYSLADKIILAKVNSNLQEIDSLFKNHKFYLALKIINKQIIDLSTWYFDLIKDSLYCDEKNNPKRKAIQSVLNYIFCHYLMRLSIILPHTCEEAYQYYNLPNKSSSVFLDSLKNIEIIENSEIYLKDYEDFLKFKNLIYAEIEVLRDKKIINKNNEVSITLPKNLVDVNKVWFKHLKEWLNVAEIKINEKITEIQLSKTNFYRCERCWTHYEDSYFPTKELCLRCHKVLNLSS